MTAVGNDGAAARLKADIDRGRTGDKVLADDPGAAPLGTDEEAAGTPTPPDAVSASACRLSGTAQASGTMHAPPEPQPGRPSEWTLGGILWLAAALVAAVAIIAAIFVVRGG